jgi:hypothetical protein
VDDIACLIHSRQTTTEAMLAVQMIAANDAALLFLRRATADG